MKMNLQKAGGLAALFEALAYVVGFAFMLTVLQEGLPENAAPAAKLAHILGMAPLFQAWNIVIYVLFGAVLVILVTALHERMKAGAAALMNAASAFGLIWAGMVIATGMIANIGLTVLGKLFAANPQQATAMWQTLNVVQEGLGGGVELVGGLWLILVSLAALRTAAWPKLLNYLGLVVGAAGVLTVVPSLGELGAVFGLGQIVWFSWLGVLLLRQPVQEQARPCP